MLLENLLYSHAAELFQVTILDDESRFQYLLSSKPTSESDVYDWIHKLQQKDDLVCYVIRHKMTNQMCGNISLMRITVEHGVLEIGGVYFGLTLSKTRDATECIYLLLRHAFDEMKYRRVEWKCNNKNEPSKQAALRFGFHFEGLFRKHMIVKGESRDTAWFAMIDDDWIGGVKNSFELWLHQSNFDETGKQIFPLQHFRDSN